MGAGYEQRSGSLLSRIVVCGWDMCNVQGICCSDCSVGAGYEQRSGSLLFRIVVCGWDMCNVRRICCFGW